MNKVSVIVPVYNVEEYLPECLDSVVNQTLGDIEIICVNDGSTDGSLRVLEEYAESDDRIKIISQENKGPGARNTGLDNSTGKYIYFMDADDFIELNTLEKLYGLAEDKSLDIVIFKLINFDNDTYERFSSNYYDMKFLKEKVGDNVFSHRDVAEDIYRIAVSPPGKFYRHELIKDMRFLEGIIFEDNPFFIEAMFKAEKVYFYDEYLYSRRIRSNSITTSKNKKFMDSITVSNMLIDITKAYGFYEEYRGGLFKKTIKNIFSRFKQIDEEYKEEFFLKIKEDFSSKEDEYKHDYEFNKLSERLKLIFKSAITCENYKEYELTIDNFDLAKSNKKLKKQNSKLKKEIKSYEKSNETILNSESWKSTRPLRKIIQLFK